MNKEQELKEEIEKLVKEDVENYSYFNTSKIDRLQAELKGYQEAREEFERLIDSIEIEFPDDDGIPVDISADDFKKELKNQLKRAGK